MKKRTRKELHQLFKQGAMPSGADFADLIESTLNTVEDGIEKPVSSDQPLKITAQGVDENVLDIWTSNKNPAWRINQKSLDKKRTGLNLSSLSVSKMFIENSTGNIGINTDTPVAKLHIKQTGNQPALRIDDKDNDMSPFVIDSEGNVGIGTTNPAPSKLKILKSDNEFINFDFHTKNKESTGQLEFVGWNGGWNINAKTDGKHLYLNRDAGSKSDIIIGRAGKELVIKGSDGNVGIGAVDPKAKLDVGGNIFAGNSDIYFTKTDHDHSGIGNAEGYAAIENTQSHGALMILGRSLFKKGKLNQRMVRLWDYLQVNGSLDVTNSLSTKNLSVPAGNSVSGIPIIDFQDCSWKFSSHKGSRKDLQKDITFSQPVEKATALLSGWFLEYKNRELVQQIGVTLETKISGSKVAVKAHCYLKDKSGNYDDPFGGHVNVLVIVKLKKSI